MPESDTYKMTYVYKSNLIIGGPEALQEVYVCGR